MSAEIYLRYRPQGAAIAQVAHVIRLVQVRHIETDELESSQDETMEMSLGVLHTIT